MERVLVLASGTKDGGGTGFENLVQCEREGILKAHIAGVVSNHPEGGVCEKADKLEVPFYHMAPTFKEVDYSYLVRKFEADWVVLCGWFKMVFGLPASRVVNIHPAPLPRFGGKGCYGRKVFAQVLEAFNSREVEFSAVNIHFAVPGEYDRNETVVFRHAVQIMEGDTPERLMKRTQRIEHYWYPRVLNLIISGGITCSPNPPYEVTLPEGYNLHCMERQFNLTHLTVGEMDYFY